MNISPLRIYLKGGMLYFCSCRWYPCRYPCRCG
nr:MAG TPA: Kti11, Kti13 transfer, tRNA modification, Complex [Inoviridae sp.]